MIRVCVIVVLLVDLSMCNCVRRVLCDDCVLCFVSCCCCIVLCAVYCV